MKKIEQQLVFFLTLLLCGAIATVRGDNVPCALRETKYGSVCVCNATYCDYLSDPTPVNVYEFAVVSSTKAGLRFETTKGKFNVFKKYFILDYDQRLPKANEESMPNLMATFLGNERAPTTRSALIEVNRTVKYQKIVGFGGSFTGAVSYLLHILPKELADHVYKSYYAQDGLAFNLMRISIGGCDFDLAPWAYNELPENDDQLSNFTLDARDKFRFSQIKRLKEVSNAEYLKIKGAAWSAPRWMKTNNDWTGRSRLKEEYYQVWADYHLKWLELMEENGLPVWAISTGNEPMNGVAFMYFVKFMSMGWTPQKQAVWLADHLGPTIRKSKFKDIILFGNDDQRYTFPSWFHQMRAVRQDSVDYLDGLAVHWYWDEIFGPSFIKNAVAEMPDKIILITESCIGDKPWQTAAPLLGSWERGEKYARAFLQEFQIGLNGWIDWNLILDEKGGPNYVDNTVDAPVVVDNADTTEVLKQPMFYAMGHFAKFAPVDSVRIEAVRSNVNIDTVAFERPDGSIAVVVFNSGRSNVEVSIVDSERGVIVLNIPPKSIHTVLYK